MIPRSTLSLLFTKKKKIDPSKISDAKFIYEFENSPECNNDLFLFREIEKSDSKFYEEMYQACTFSGIAPPQREYLTDKIELVPKIHIKFSRRVNISCIILLNPTTHADKPNISLSKGQIFFENKLIWTGRVKQRYPDQAGERESATFIFLTDDLSKQQKIKEELFPKRKQQDKYALFE